VEVVDYDFQVEYGTESFLVRVISPSGPDTEKRKVEIYRGDYNGLYNQEIFKLVSITGDDEQALEDPIVGFITSL